MYLFLRVWKKRYTFRDKNLLRSINYPYCLNCFSILRQGLFYGGLIEHQGFCSVPVRIGRNSSPIWSYFLNWLRERIGMSPWGSLETHYWEVGGLWKACSSDEGTQSACVCDSFPIAEAINRKVLVSFSFHLLKLNMKLRIKNFGSFLGSESSRVQDSWIARLTKSGVDMVSHSILFF